jgi:membrane-associated phospholipid phosphatase
MTGCALLLLLILSFLLDDTVDRWVAAHQIPGWKTAAKICSRYFAWPWLMLGAGGGLLVAWLRNRRDWMRVLCAMMIAASLAGLAADLLRGVTGRTRPYAQAPQGWYGVRAGAQWLIIKHAYNSFPSGHATTIVAFSLPLFFWRRSLGLVVFCSVGAVAGARVYLGAHHLSDVVAGAILGTVVAVLVWRRFNSSARPPPVSA